MSVWRPGGKARISVSALLRIQRDDGCFAVIKNLHRPEDYSAIGGVYKCHPKSGPLELDALGSSRKIACKARTSPTTCAAIRGENSSGKIGRAACRERVCQYG